MHTSEAEKDWLRRICGGQPVTEQQTAPAKEAEHKPVAEKKANGHGFGDIAGMNELKEFVTEGFINVLKNRKCAEVYGIKPPSMLFYGPAGCGKTFFAEKMAEEIGINFMKIVPDDLACTWVHGTQQKIGEVFKDAEKKAPTLLFFDEFDAMVPKRSGDEANQHYDSEVNEFLCMLNNASERGVYVLAATNHPERIDKAVQVRRTHRLHSVTLQVLSHILRHNPKDIGLLLNLSGSRHAYEGGCRCYFNFSVHSLIDYLISTSISPLSCPSLTIILAFPFLSPIRIRAVAIPASAFTPSLFISSMPSGSVISINSS